MANSRSNPTPSNIRTLVKLTSVANEADEEAIRTFQVDQEELRAYLYADSDASKDEEGPGSYSSAAGADATATAGETGSNFDSAGDSNSAPSSSTNTKDEGCSSSSY